MTSLHDIAPRLAVARDVERWNIWCAGDEAGIKDGDAWAETVSATHDVQSCRCGADLDHYIIRQRFLHGSNRGQIHTTESWKCRRCGSCSSSHR